MAERQFSVVRLDAVEPARVEWIWPGWLASGKLHLACGMPGVGKSFVTCDLAARVSVGAAWPDGSPGGAPADVIFLAAEDGLADTIRPRLDAHGADATRIHIVQSRLIAATDGNVTESPVSLLRDVEQLGATLAAMPAVRLLIVDPISEYLDGVDGNKNNEVRAALAPLAKMAERCRVAVVAVSHFNKGTIGPALNRAIGSIAFVAQSRIAWAFIRDADDADRVFLLQTKSNLHKRPPGLAYRIAGDAQTARVEWEPGQVGISADEALESRRKGPSPDRLDQAADWLAAALAAGEAEAAGIERDAKEKGIAHETLKRARKRLGVKARRDGSTGRWLIALSQEGQVPSRQLS